MGKREVTRRQLLAGVAGATGIGATIGTGTAAMVADEAFFRNGSIRSGHLNLTVDWASGGESGTSTGLVEVPISLSQSDPEATIDLTLSLPTDDEPNNPAYAWVRSSCIDDGLLADLDVTVRYPSCGDNCVIYEGPIDGLADGLVLDADSDGSLPAGDQRCLQPGEELRLAMDLRLGDIDRNASDEFSLTFAGTQCRNTSGTTSPFPASDCGAGNSRAISYIAFCTTSSGDLNPEFQTVASDEDGPTKVSWQTVTDVDIVCVKSGTTLKVYDFRGPQMTSNQVSSGDPEAAISGLRVQRTDNESPCGTATAALSGTIDGTMQTTTYEWVDGAWEVRN